MPRRRRSTNKAKPVGSDGTLAVAFVNVGADGALQWEDYVSFLKWCVVQGALDAAAARRLETLVDEQPKQADLGLATIEKLHALLNRILNGLADGKAPPGAILDEFNVALAEITPRPVLTQGATSLVWVWPEGERDARVAVHAVIRSATRLLTTTDYGKVKRCEGEDCDVLFLAKNPGPARRWCSDVTCGTRVRSRLYERRRIRMGRAK